MRIPFAVVTAVLLLQGCTTATSEEGIEISVSATGRNGVAPETVNVTGGGTATTPESEHDHNTYRSDGMKVEVEAAAINLQLVSIDPCTGPVKKVLAGLGNFLVSSAYAHGDEVEVEASGINLLEDETVQLGSLPQVPGEYCGATLEIVPGREALPDYAAIAAAHVPPVNLSTIVTSDLSGVGVNLTACFYYPSQGATREAAYNQASHTCVTNIREIRAPRQVKVAFDSPVTVDAATRSIKATLRVRYDRWFEGIAIDGALDTAHSGTQVRRYSTGYPNFLRPFPDKNAAVNAAAADTAPVKSNRPCTDQPSLSASDRANVDAACTAELAGFVDQLVDNIADPANYEVGIVAE